MGDRCTALLHAHQAWPLQSRVLLQGGTRVCREHRELRFTLEENTMELLESALGIFTALLTFDFFQYWD